MAKCVKDLMPGAVGMALPQCPGLMHGEITLLSSPPWECAASPRRSAIQWRPSPCRFPASTSALLTCAVKQLPPPHPSFDYISALHSSASLAEQAHVMGDPGDPEDGLQAPAK